MCLKGRALRFKTLMVSKIMDLTTTKESIFATFMTTWISGMKLSKGSVREVLVRYSDALTT